MAAPTRSDERPVVRTAGDPDRHRAVLRVLLGVAVTVAAALTLTPEGTGWAWGSPLVELRWYAAGLDSGATVVQLVGNLGLLVVPAALGVLLWPPLGRPAVLAGVALAVGTGIEMLQFLLSIGRVVSPLDAALNAVGAVAAGLLVAHVQRLVVASASRDP